MKYYLDSNVTARHFDFFSDYFFNGYRLSWLETDVPKINLKLNLIGIVLVPAFQARGWGPIHRTRRDVEQCPSKTHQGAKFMHQTWKHMCKCPSPVWNLVKDYGSHQGWASSILGSKLRMMSIKSTSYAAYKCYS